MEQVRQILKLGSDAGFVEGGVFAWHRAFAEAGRTLDDLSVVETYDFFTIAERMQYEATGLAPARQAVLEGWTAADRRLPVNQSGGLTAEFHPIDATGVSVLFISAMQLTGTPGAMQLPRADMGGPGVAYGSIPEPRRG